MLLIYKGRMQKTEMKIINGIKKPFKFIKKKTEPAREFLNKGGMLGMIFEIVLATQFTFKEVISLTSYKFHPVLCMLITSVIWICCAELISLAVKIVFGVWKRSKAYFATSLFAVIFVNSILTHGNVLPVVILTDIALVLSVDILGRVILGFFRTKRFRQVTAYVLTVLCAAYLTLFSVFYHNDNFGSSRIDFYNNIEGQKTSSVPGFKEYLNDGSYQVRSLSYGPDAGDDILTDTLDLTVFDDIAETEDSFDKIAAAFSDMDYAKTPVKGQIWYPEGKTGCTVLFFVHGNHDSSVPSYLGYEYLGQYLASNGYVVVSVDENIINKLGAGNDMRAYLLLENMKAIMGEVAVSGSPLSGLIDPDLIAIGGHSRGGEMVATAYLFNDLDAYPEDGNIKFDYHFNITSIVAVAPVVDQYTPVGRAVEISDVNYLLIHGSNDQDVSAMMGEIQYNNITFSGDPDRFFIKSSVYILGANHGQFNSLWGRYDSPVGTGFLNTHNFIGEADQMLIAKAYIRSFLDSTVLGDRTYSALLSDISSFEGDLPDTVYITDYQDSTFKCLADFDDTVDISRYGQGTGIDCSGTKTWTLAPYSRGNNGESENYVLSMEWEKESEPVLNVSFPAIDITGGSISFGIADMREDTENITEGLDYTLELTDASGNKVSIKSPVLVFHTPAVQLYKQDIIASTYEYKHQLQTVNVTPEMFGQTSFDFRNVTGITIKTDGTEEGGIIIDSIGYY